VVVGIRRRLLATTAAWQPQRRWRRRDLRRKDLHTNKKRSSNDGMLRRLLSCVPGRCFLAKVKNRLFIHWYYCVNGVGGTRRSRTSVFLACIKTFCCFALIVNRDYKMGLSAPNAILDSIAHKRRHGWQSPPHYIVCACRVPAYGGFDSGGEKTGQRGEGGGPLVAGSKNHYL